MPWNELERSSMIGGDGLWWMNWVEIGIMVFGIDREGWVVCIVIGRAYAEVNFWIMVGCIGEVYVDGTEIWRGIWWSVWTWV